MFAQRTRSCHETLSANGSKHIIWHQTILRHHVGFEPYTQRIRITQRHNVTYTRDTHQTRLDIDINIVGDEIGIVLAVDRFEGTDMQNIILLLHHLHTYFSHLSR